MTATGFARVVSLLEENYRMRLSNDLRRVWFVRLYEIPDGLGEAAALRCIERLPFRPTLADLLRYVPGETAILPADARAAMAWGAVEQTHGRPHGFEGDVAFEVAFAAVAAVPVDYIATARERFLVVYQRVAEALDAGVDPGRFLPRSVRQALPQLADES